MNHYTYMMSLNEGTDKELFYIGVRSFAGDPNDDINYLGSSRLLNHLILSGLDFTKEILETYPSRDQAYESEQNLISQCIDNFACLNLMCSKEGYGYNSALVEFKLRHIKKHYPEIIPTGKWNPIYRYLNAKDMVYFVGEYLRALKFIGHPENLKYYYPGTGTKTYWPGREDRLMTQKLKSKTFYTTAVDEVDGTPEEQIKELISNHLISGQKTPILETCIELQSLIKDNLETYKLIETQLDLDKNFTWLKNRLKRSIK